MSATLPGLDLPLSMGAILRRLAREPEAARAPEPPTPALPLPLAPKARGGRTWFRHDLPRTGGYELRLDGAAIVRVQPCAAGWRVENRGAGSMRELATAEAADAMAARIARLMALA